MSYFVAPGLATNPSQRIIKDIKQHKLCVVDNLGKLKTVQVRNIKKFVLKPVTT